MKPMGIYGLETLDCKCEVKSYRGGKVVFVRYVRCKTHFESSVYFVCGVCGKKFSKRDLKEHKWSHAID